MGPASELPKCNTCGFEICCCNPVEIKPIPAYQQRVIEEKEELDEKRFKLRDFRDGKVFEALPVDEKGRLNRQVEVMCSYSEILAERIANF